MKLFQAGIPDHMLLLALEPEAASLYCKRELGTDTIPIGCRYLVLDLGGETSICQTSHYKIRQTISFNLRFCLISFPMITILLLSKTIMMTAV
jgi:hypothetical protein